MNELEKKCTYRSPKTAAREEAVRLRNGLEPRNLEASSTYDPNRHIQYPRMIELKPSRFADTAVLMDKLASRVFIGEGDDVRLPALRRMRNRPKKEKVFRDDPLLQLGDDWADMDLKKEIKEVLTDPANERYIRLYEEIALDIATDPDAEESTFDSETVEEELALRINLSNSFETERSGMLLTHWGLENLPRDVKTTDEKRLFLISCIPFFENMAEMEVEHLHKYYLGKWNEFRISSKDAGIGLVKDFEGNHTFKILEKAKRPERVSGLPVGCPAGFTFEDIAASGLGKVMTQKPSVIHRSLVAFVNEAYDRGILGKVAEKQQQ